MIELSPFLPCLEQSIKLIWKNIWNIRTKLENYAKFERKSVACKIRTEHPGLGIILERIMDYYLDNCRSIQTF